MFFIIYITYMRYLHLKQLKKAFRLKASDRCIECFKVQYKNRRLKPTDNYLLKISLSVSLPLFLTQTTIYILGT